MVVFFLQSQDLELGRRPKDKSCFWRKRHHFQRPVMTANTISIYMEKLRVALSLTISLSETLAWFTNPNLYPDFRNMVFLGDSFYQPLSMNIWMARRGKAGRLLAKVDSLREQEKLWKPDPQILFFYWKLASGKLTVEPWKSPILSGFTHFPSPIWQGLSTGTVGLTLDLISMVSVSKCK